MKLYEFTITLQGKGTNKQSAWEDAFECFSTDPGSPEEDQTKVVANCCDECSVSEDEEALFVDGESLYCKACEACFKD